MSMAALRSLCVTPRLVVTDLACRSGRSGKGPSRGGERTHLVLVRRGAFGAHLGSRDYLADPWTALVSWEGTEYRISHPGDAGDDCTVFELEPSLSDELLRGMRPRIDLELRLDPAIQVAHAAFLALVRRGEDDLAREEAALELLGALLARAPRHRPERDPGRRAVAFAAAELINQDLAANRSVSALADAIGCSPGHLMRSFRAVTGASLRGKVEGKAAFVATFTDPDLVLDPFTIRNPVFVRLGDRGGLVGGEAILSGTDSGKRFSEHIHYADVFTWRDGRWQVAYVQVTPIP